LQTVIGEYIGDNGSERRYERRRESIIGRPLCCRLSAARSSRSAFSRSSVVGSYSDSESMREVMLGVNDLDLLLDVDELTPFRNLVGFS